MVAESAWRVGAKVSVEGPGYTSSGRRNQMKISSHRQVASAYPRATIN